MAEPLDVLVAIEAGLAVLFAIFLVARGLGSPARWVLAALLADFGVVAALTILPRLLDSAGLQRDLRLPLVVARTFLISLHLSFAVVFPHWTLNARRAGALVGALVPSLAIASFILFNPTLVLTRSGGPTGFTHTLEILIVASHFPALWIFGRYWLKTESGDFRSQFFYVLVAYLLWNVNYALDRIVQTFLHPQTFGPILLTFGFFLLFLQFLAVLIIAFGALARWLRRRRQGRREDGRFVAWLFLGIPLTFLQFLGTAGPLFVAGLFAPLLFYGGAKYQVVDLQIQLKRGLRGSILGGSGLVVVFVAEETLQYAVGRFFGFLGALLIAVAVIVAFTPLRRAARRWSDQAMPEVDSSESYLVRRRFELYRVALEGMIRDEVLDPRETQALAGLRRELKITEEEHESLERTLRSKMGLAAATG